MKTPDSGIPSIESESKPFNWKEWVREISMLTPETIARLDALTELVNGPDGEEFRRDLCNPTVKMAQPLWSLTGYFRDVLLPDERKK